MLDGSYVFASNLRFQFSNALVVQLEVRWQARSIDIVVQQVPRGLSRIVQAPKEVDVCSGENLSKPPNEILVERVIRFIGFVGRRFILPIVAAKNRHRRQDGFVGMNIADPFKLSEQRIERIGRLVAADRLFENSNSTKGFPSIVDAGDCPPLECRTHSWRVPKASSHTDHEFRGHGYFAVDRR